MRYPITKSQVNYSPNRLEEMPVAPKEKGGYVHYPEQVSGVKARLHSPKFQEYTNQATMFYNSLEAHEKLHLQRALSFELGKCDDEGVINKMIDRLNIVSFELAQIVAEQIGAESPSKPMSAYYPVVSPRLSQTAFAPTVPIIATRRIAILLVDGFESEHLTQIKAKLHDVGQALCFIIGQRRGSIKASDGSKVSADYSFETCRSTLFDAVIVPGGANHAVTLKTIGRARHFVLEAFMHCKVIGAIGEGVEFIQTACNLPGITIALNPNSAEVVDDYGVVTSYQLGSSSFTPGKGNDF